jgi:hypothetical protein
VIFLKALLVWLSFGIVAFAFGALREFFLRSRVGELRAHQIGTLIVCAVIATIIVFAVQWLRPSPQQAIAIGVFWTVLTVTFEFGMFHYIMGEPWERLTSNYNLAVGRLWPLLLLIELVGPYLAVRKLAKSWT